MQTHDPQILVLGGTGKTGRRIAERLVARGLPVRVGSRSASPAFDWNDRSSWAPALEGVSAIYISYFPDIALPGAKRIVEALAKLALERGIRRFVLLSGRGEEEALATEDALSGLGADLTIVRASWFMQNFSEGAFAEDIAAGELALPVGQVREPFVDAEDIADVAVAALTDDRHIGHTYEVTGPRLLTFAEAVGEIAAATGREVRCVRIAPEEFRANLVAAGMTEDVIWLLDELFTRVLDGRNEYLGDGVQRALGRLPRDFSTYLRETAASGIWPRAQPA